MKSDFTKQYLDYVSTFLECLQTGQLINITKVYNDYGKPPFKSPRRILNQKYFKLTLLELVEENKYEMEKVIIYSGKDVFVTYVLAFSYLNKIDRKNFRRLRDYICENHSIAKLLDRMPLSDLNEAGSDYLNLPF